MASNSNSSEGQRMAQQRLRIIAGHLQKHEDGDSGIIAKECKAEATGSTEENKGTVPRKRQLRWALIQQEIMKWNGWGYSDSKFLFNKKGQAEFTGKRTGLRTPIGDSVKHKSPATPVLNASAVPPPSLNEAFVEDLNATGIPFSNEADDRVFRAHGHCLHEIFALREGKKFERVPDVVVWPNRHNDVVKLVELACKHNVCLIPYGGGTSVTSALERSVSTEDALNRKGSGRTALLWTDEKYLVAHVEAGIIGQDLERLLNESGYCTGHEPDSTEFSSLSGWVAARASGMKKNLYGNIEDLVIHIKAVTPRGVMEKSYQGAAHVHWARHPPLYPGLRRLVPPHVRLVPPHVRLVPPHKRPRVCAEA
ncbi:unnamed protein product [Coregonus sp. 'balchen']|nr:unnamed protein product [Coregonus sp. 'balchen']